ncbi:MAG: site-specific integrase [Desulfobacterales bacterium]|nr:MAG: site-specific integrase [Desulfobacterales bacterium]
MGELTDEQIQEMIKKYFRNYSKGLEMMRAEAGPFGKGDTFQTINQITQSVCKQAKKDLTDCNYFDYWVFASQILKNEGIEVEKGSLIHNKICRELLKGMIKFGEIEDRRHNGDYSDDLKAIFPLTSDKKAEMPPSESPKDVIPITLKQLINNYFSEMIKSVQWAESTQKEYTTSYNLLIDFLGTDRQVNTIGDQDMLTYKRVLLKLPPFFSTSKKYKGMTLMDVLENDFDKTLSVSAVRRYLINTSQLFDYAVSHKHMTANPAKGLLPPKSKRPQDERAAFDKDDLNKIFQSEQYQEDSFEHSYQFWLSPLGAYTGARIEELCQLHVDDLKQEEGIWYFDINDDGEKKLKNKASNRVVPLHPVLVETLNFPGFIQNLRERGEDRIFPELKLIGSKYSHYASRWFNVKYKKQIGLVTTEGQKKTYHSFRHLVQDWLKQKLLPEVLVAELVGHVVKGETFGRYGKHLRVKVLYEKAILELDYGIDLSHLKKSKFVPS